MPTNWKSSSPIWQGTFQDQNCVFSSLGRKVRIREQRMKVKRNYSRLKMSTRRMNNMPCFDYLSLIGAVFSPPSPLGLDPYQSIDNFLVLIKLQQSHQLHQIHSPSHPLTFPLCLLFLTHLERSESRLLVLTLLHTATRAHFVTIYSCLSLSFISALHLLVVRPLHVFAEGLLCVVAQTQAPYFHQLFFTRENGIVHQAWTLSMETPTLPTTIVLSLVLQPGSWKRLSVFTVSVSSPSYSFLKSPQPG